MPKAWTVADQAGHTWKLDGDIVAGFAFDFGFFLRVRTLFELDRDGFLHGKAVKKLDFVQGEEASERDTTGGEVFGKVEFFAILTHALRVLDAGRKAERHGGVFPGCQDGKAELGLGNADFRSDQLMDERFGDVRGGCDLLSNTVFDEAFAEADFNRRK